MNGMVRVFGVLLLGAACLFVNDCLAENKPQLKVALIFDIGGRGDGGFNDSAYRGFEKAAREFGIKTVLAEPRRSLDRESALNALAVSDADMVIGVGFAFTENMNALAARYPDKKFVCVDYGAKYDSKGNVASPAANLAGLLFREEEGSYLVGAIAALKSRAGKIGFIGGMDCPIIRKFEAGYITGAKAVKPDIIVLSRFAGITGKAFTDPEKGDAMATRMYQEGADVIFHAAGVTGDGLFRAAKRLHKFAIGVDSDQRVQAPGLVLTSMTKNVDVAVFESINALVDGRFSGGLKVFGLKEKGVGFIYDDSNKGLIPQDVYEKALELRERIVKGETVIPSSVRSKRMFTRTDLLDLLSQLHTETLAVLNKLEGDLKQSAQALSGKALKGSGARGVLKKLYTSNPYIIDCETVSDRGIMLVVEPQEFGSSEGADISKQAHMVKLFQTAKPVLSRAFRSVEGPEAVAFHYPVFSSGTQFSGSVATLFAPEYLLSGIIGPVASILPVDISLMQTDGRMIYDIDTRQIGLNAFTAPLYAPFPEVLSLVKKVAAEKEGAGTYRFYRQGSATPVVKDAYWKTIAFHGAEWRLIIACSKDDIDPNK
jgi:basic membrane protein A and related proteins